MASTILEQVLENVQNGALLPIARREPSAADLARVEREVLARIDTELDQFVERVLALPACRRRDRGSRPQVVELFREVARGLAPVATRERQAVGERPALDDESLEVEKLLGALDRRSLDERASASALDEIQTLLDTDGPAGPGLELLR